MNSGGWSFLVVDREAHLADLAVLVDRPQDRVGGEVADQRHGVDCGC